MADDGAHVFGENVRREPIAEVQVDPIFRMRSDRFSNAHLLHSKYKTMPFQPNLLSQQQQQQQPDFRWMFLKRQLQPQQLTLELRLEPQQQQQKVEL